MGLLGPWAGCAGSPHVRLVSKACGCPQGPDRRSRGLCGAVDLTNVYKYLTGECEEGVKLFSVVSSDRKRTNFFREGGQALNTSPIEEGVSILGDIPDPPSTWL